ncbi:MAG: hypothetical protein ACAF41_24140 [Leptolyngbya sp. BL-A-14]
MLHHRHFGSSSPGFSVYWYQFIYFFCTVFKALNVAVRSGELDYDGMQQASGFGS